VTFNRSELELLQWLRSYDAAVALRSTLGTLGALALAYLSYELFEKRFLRHAAAIRGHQEAGVTTWRSSQLDAVVIDDPLERPAPGTEVIELTSDPNAGINVPTIALRADPGSSYCANSVL
jgi:hypothetical protein